MPLPLSEEEIQRRFGARLRKERLSADLSQEQLASEASLDRSYVGSVERGERNISLLNIARLSYALGLSPKTLVEGLFE